MKRCIHEEVENSLNCTFNRLFALAGLDECKNPILKEYWDEDTKCERKCPVSCDSTQFSTQDTVIETCSSKDVETAFIFTVFDLTSLETTQIPKMNAFSLVSNIGGALGLFLGIVFLDFIEIFEFFIAIFVLICNH